MCSHHSTPRIIPCADVFVVVLGLVSLQDQYAKEFSTFKPDKRLRWLPHLGSVHLELQLEDRTVEADVPPLEAAFIELFSSKSMSHFFPSLVCGN